MNSKYTFAIFTVWACCSVAVAENAQSIRTPSLDEYCVTAQRLVTRTTQPVEIRVQESFDGFVKSKAIIPDGEGALPEIQQYHWTGEDGSIVGISCKLKSADHLNLVYGEGTAGPDGACQDMNRYVFDSFGIPPEQVVYSAVIFDPTEKPQTEGQPPAKGGPGPQWLQSYVATDVDADGALIIRTKGFRVDFTDPRFAGAPARFRGVHYCHFIAPDHLRELVTGTAKPGVVIGQEVDLTRYGLPEGKTQH